MRIYFFCDLETSGLDPIEDRIVEIGWLYADVRLRRLAATSYSAVRPVGSALERIEANDVVREMHEKTGLLEILKGDPTLPPLAAVESTIIEELDNIEARYQEFVKTLDAEGRLDPAITEHVEFVMAGKNVHFDKQFVERYMPRLAARLSHRVFDESTLKYLMDALDVGVNIVPTAEGNELAPHRAGFDIELTYTTMRFVLQQFITMAKHPDFLNDTATGAFLIDGSSDEPFEKIEIGKLLDEGLRKLLEDES